MNTETWIGNVASSNNLSQNGKLKITDLSKLKITKIRYDKIHFKYDGQRYFVIAHWDCGDSWYSLYKKDCIDGYWKVELLTTSGWTGASIDYLLDKKSRTKRNIIYSHIDKKYFVNKLREKNLVE